MKKRNSFGFQYSRRVANSTSTSTLPMPLIILLHYTFALFAHACILIVYDIYEIPQ